MSRKIDFESFMMMLFPYLMPSAVLILIRLCFYSLQSESKNTADFDKRLPVLGTADPPVRVNGEHLGTSVYAFTAAGGAIMLF